MKRNRRETAEESGDSLPPIFVPKTEHDDAYFMKYTRTGIKGLVFVCPQCGLASVTTGLTRILLQREIPDVLVHKSGDIEKRTNEKNKNQAV